jgi:hypothetical protein
MFNIKLPKTSIDCRTVTLTKNKVEVNGACKLLVIISDITDRVKLEREKIKKGRERESTSEVQGRLEEGFQRHCEEVKELCCHLDVSELKNLALSVKRTTCDLFLNFCQFTDLISIQNDTFR